MSVRLAQWGVLRRRFTQHSIGGATVSRHTRGCTLHAVMAERVPYGSWSLTELKRELRKRGAKLNGRKHELVERLNIADIVFIYHLLI